MAEGCVLCAEQLFLSGNATAAAEIYDEVRQADVPKQRVIEATRGAILARKQDGIPLLLEQFRSADKSLFQLALGTAREFPGDAVDQALADEVEKTSPQRAALLIVAMADRPDTVILPAIVKAASQGPRPVRLAALDALGRVGDASCLPTLLEATLEADAELVAAAKNSLAALPSDKVDSEIAALLPTAKGKTYTLLLELVGERRIDAVPALLKAIENADPAVRGAALTALGETVALQRLPVLIAQVISPKYPQDAAVAQAALKAASVRMPDREACAAELAAAVNRAPAITKTALLEILAEVGGTKALQTLAAAAKSKDPELQDAASRLLGKWNSVAAAPVLLDLAKTAPAEKYKVRALRGYIGVARKFNMPEADRVAMCQQALDTAFQTAEKQLVLDVLQVRPSPEALRLAIQTTKVPELKQAATKATLVIAQKVGGKDVDVNQLLATIGLEKVKLEIVKAEYGAGSTFKDVTAIVRKHAGDSALIALPAASYNASFGGDPLPGNVKQLKIQYRLNGKLGTVTLAEDALILLPTPK